MPSITFPEYAQQFERILNHVVATGEAVLVSIQIDRRSRQQGFIAGLLQFQDGSELHFREYVDMRLSDFRVMYAYHYQNVNRNLVFRYDNARHRPPLLQAEHKHSSVGIEICRVPDLKDVIDEIVGGLSDVHNV